MHARSEPPLISLGQGDFRRDIYPEDFGMTTSHDKSAPIDLRSLIREPEDVYHSKRPHFLTSHKLAEFRRCPLLYHRRDVGLIPDVDSAAYLQGRAAHALILEGREQYKQRYAIGGPVNPKTGNPYGEKTKKFQEWAESQDRDVLSDVQAATVEQMAAAVKDHAVASVLLSDGVAESTARVEYCGHKCQIRIDWLNPTEGIVDLKTSRDLDTFEAQIREYGYAHQLAFYHAVLSAFLKRDRPIPVYIVAVEKSEPFRCGVWHIQPWVLAQARQQNERAMHELLACNQEGDWFTRYEELRQVDQL